MEQSVPCELCALVAVADRFNGNELNWICNHFSMLLHLHRICKKIMSLRRVKYCMVFYAFATAKAPIADTDGSPIKARRCGLSAFEHE